MSVSMSCSTCGHELPPGVLEEFCPVCSLAGALGEQERRGAAPPEMLRYVGDYELVSLIARGGMGVVYRARQRSLGRTVAVKLMLGGELADQMTRQRFHAEAAAAARLQHPNIVAIHEVGEHHGQPFFSMDYIEGSTLAELVREQPLSARRAAELVRLIAEAVHYAHTQGVLHRDLKPSNVLVDTFGQPRVTDFGLAKRVERQSELRVESSAAAREASSQLSTLDSQLTRSSQVLGSPAYMPPEQAFADRHSVGPVSDVYSLGAILYQLLTARAPFQGESPQAVLLRVRDTEPVAPRALNPDVPADLETVCLKCLEKEPARRYASAQELAEDLTRFLDGQPVRARPVGPLGKLWRWSQRHPVVASLTAVIALLLLATALGATLAALRIQRAERSALAHLRDALLEQARAQRRSGRMGQRVESLKALRAAAALDGGSPDFRTLLRSEAIASLALIDAEIVHVRPLPSPTTEGTYLFSPDLRWLARLKADGRVVIEGFPELAPVTFVVETPTNTVRVAGFAPRMNHLAVQLRDGTIQLWDWRDGAMIWQSAPGLAAVAFSPDGRQLAATSLAGPVYLFDLPGGALAREFPGRGKGYAVAFSPDSKRLACVRHNSRDVELLETASGNLLGLLPHRESIIALAWSPDGRSLACACIDGLGYVWGTDAGEVRVRLEGHDWTVAACAFNAAGNLIATTSYDDTTRLWDATNGRLLLTIPAATYQLQFSLDDQNLSFVPTTGRTAWLALHRADAFAALSSPRRIGGVHSISVSADGHWVAPLSEAELYLWDHAGRRLVYREPALEGRRVLFHPRESKLLVVTRKGVYLREYAPPATKGEAPVLGEKFMIATNSGWVNAAFSSDGTWIALANFARKEAVVVRTDGSSAPIVIGPHPGVSAVALSPDGRTLATAPFIGPPVHVWDIPSARLIKQLNTGPKCDANFSPDGRWLLTVGDRAQLWDTTTWTEVSRPDLDQHTINAGIGAFSSDGRWLAVTDKHRQVHLLQFPECRRVGVLEGPNQPGIFGMQFSPASHQIAVICSYGHAQWWNLSELERHLAQLDLDFPGRDY